MALPPTHQAALDGDLAALNRLIEEDGRRLDAQNQERAIVDCYIVKSCTPLMLAAYKGHDAVVARLIELGADVLAVDGGDGMAAHWACRCKQASALALLLDAGASINARDNCGWTPLTIAAIDGATDCVKLLLARGGGALELDARCSGEWTALHYTSSPAIVQLLLHAGADPTIRDEGHTPLDYARIDDYAECIPLLQAALAEPQRPRLLLKARALLDAAIAIPDAAQDALDKGLPPAEQLQASLAVAPTYLKGRVQQGQQLPRVSVDDDHGQDDDEVVACLQYALGLAYGGGVHFEGEEQPVGMLREVFVELCELLVPKWDRKNV